VIKRILIIGGYGNFGSYISAKLSLESDIQIIVAGRTEDKCKSFIEGLTDVINKPEYAVLDITKGLEQSLIDINPDIVIHTSGPYQGQGYDVATACIEYGCHYLDLADARDFVSGISALDALAKEKGVSVISGVSSVPCLSSAVIDKYKPQFQKLETIDYGIATAQQTNKGLATTSAILSYTGKPFKTLINGEMKEIYGWQDLHFYRYPELGYRALCNCEIPDLSLFPKYYPDLKTIRFYAGTEILFMHIGLWFMSWLVRFKVILSLESIARPLLRVAHMFDWMGTSKSAFHMELKGVGLDGQELSKTFYVLAKSGDGPFIPCAPSIILAKQLARGELRRPGAYPCLSLIDLDTYMKELEGLDIKDIRDV